jgi:rhomboid protease GluP
MAKTYQASIPTDLTPSQFLMLTSLCMEDLQWPHRFLEDDRIEAANRVGSNTQKITVTVNGGEASIQSKYEDWVLTDLGKNKKTADQLIATIEAKRPLFTGEALGLKLEELKAESTRALKDLEARMATGELTASEKISLGVGGHYITYGLVGLNVLVFIVMVIAGVHIFKPSVPDLLNWGGNHKLYTLGGEWWRLITSVFIHIGIIHLVFNMYALFTVGVYLEPLLGRWKFLFAYLCTGVFASLTSIYWHDNTVSAGASGAIFGLYGFFLALLTTKLLDPQTKKALLTSIAVFVGYNLLYGMKDGVDNAAHLGGLISGFILGYFYYFTRDREWGKYFSAICVVITLAVAGLFLSKNKADDSAAFYRILSEFGIIETKAMQPFMDREKLTSAEFIRQSNEVSLPLWADAKAAMKPADDMKLPAELERQRKLLVDYINLRIQFTTAMVEAEKLGEQGNWDEVNSLAAKIEQVINEMEKTAK